MKLTCMAQMYNERSIIGSDGRSNLERFLLSIDKYCDALVMYDDASTDGSVGLLELWRASLPLCDDSVRLKEIHIIRGTINEFNAEMSHKVLALDKCKQIGSDWILWLDVDEVIEARGEQGALRELCEGAKRGAINLFNRNLWRSDRYYRVDELWNAGLFCRLWRVTDELQYYRPTPGLHQDLVPKNIEGRDTKNLRVIHYGFATDKNILRKYHTYKSHGQKGRALQRLVDEKTIRLCSADPLWFNDTDWPHGPETILGKIEDMV